MTRVPAPRRARAAADGGGLSADRSTALLARGLAPPRRAGEDQQAQARRRAAPPRDRLMAGTVHIVGAGLSGPVRRRRARAPAASRWSSTRRRSSPAAAAAPIYDSVIDLVIDNGNHLLLSGNRAALDYLGRIGGLGAHAGGAARRSFLSPTSRPANAGRCGRTTAACRGGFFRSSRRVPGTRAPEYLAPLGVLRAQPAATVGDAMDCRGPLYERLLAAGPARRAQHRAARGRRAACRADHARDASGGRAGLPAARGAAGLNDGVRRSGAALPSRTRRDGRLRALAAQNCVRRRTRVAELDFGEDRIPLARGRPRDPRRAARRGAGPRAGPRLCRKNSTPSSMRISASRRRPDSRRSSAW